MKRNLQQLFTKILVFSAIILSFGLNAQTITIGTGTANSYFYGPLYRSSATSTFDNSNYVYLYTATELSTIPTGALITEIAWEKSNTESMSGANFLEIQMENTSQTIIGVIGNNYTLETAASTVVYSNSNYTVPAATGWISHSLSSPFAYTGGNLKIAVGHIKSGTATGAINWNYEQQNDLAGGAASGSATISSTFTASYSNRRPNIQITYLASACTAPPTPGVTVASSNQVCVGQNLLLTLSGASGGLGQTFQWQSSSDSLQWNNISGETSPSASLTATTSQYYRCILVCSNDTAYSSPTFVDVPTGALFGTYTVNPLLPASPTNFLSITEFAELVSCVGISGNVVVDVAPNSGPYSGNILFESINGTSPLDSIVINGNGNVISGFGGYLMRLEGTSYFTINDFVFENANPSSPMFGIQLGNAANHINILNNSFDLGTGYTTSTSACISVSGSTTSATTAGNNAQYVRIENNNLSGAYYGITMMGNASYLDNYGHTIRNNTITNFYLYGVYIANGDSLEISHNDIFRDNRPLYTTFYGIYSSTTRNCKVISNKIHDSGVGSYTAYPIYTTVSVNSAGFTTDYINNLIYNIQTTGTIYAIYGLGNRDYVNFYHNTIALDVTGSTGTVRGTFISTAPNNHNFRNNIVSISGAASGTKTGFYVTNTSGSNFTSNNNVIHVDPNAGATVNFGYYGSAQITLANWQTASSQDLNSFDLDPVFANPALNLYSPLNLAIDNIGASVGVATDINGNPRSSTSPDAGAIEFTGVNADISLVDASLSRESFCYGTNDTIKATILNTIGDTVDFTITPLTFVWNITGPINSTDSAILGLGTLAPGESMVVSQTGINLSQPGNYELRGHIKSNLANLVTTNDTLLEAFTIEVKPILSVSPKEEFLTQSGQSVTIDAMSPLFPAGGNYFSEICQFRGATGAAPVGGWPTYLIADDYVELTGIPNTDLVGFTMEEWTGTTMQYSVTFPSGTVFSPNGTMILATGQLGLSAPSPNDFYYHTGNTVTHSSNTVVGYILKDPNGVIVDAVAYGPYSFPAASGVTPADWTGLPANPSSTAGIRLIAPRTQTDASWAFESAAERHDPNLLNPSLTLPSPPNITGIQWFFNGTISDTTSSVTYGPFNSSGINTAIISYFSSCGVVFDTATINVVLPISIDSTVVVHDCDSLGNGTADIFPSQQGLAPYTYQWSTGSTTSSSSGLAQGVYSVTISDAIGYWASVSFVSVGGKPKFQFQTTEPICFGDSTGSILSIPTSGENPFSFEWSSGQQTSTINNIPNGIYDVTITDGNDCVLETSVELSSPDELAGDFLISDISCFGLQDGEVSLTPEGGTAPYQVLWNTGDSALTLTNLGPDTFTVVITDANNCMGEIQIYIEEPEELDNSTRIEAESIIANLDNAAYQWIDCENNQAIDGATNQTFSPESNGNYAVIVSLDGCESQSECTEITTVGFGQIGNSTTLSVFPNPNSGNFSIQTSTSGNWSLYDALGKRINTYTFNSTNESIEVNHLGSGIYFLKSDENLSQVVKVIVK